MVINNVHFNGELIDILEELRNQLRANNISYLGKIKDSGKDVMITCPYHSFGHERRPSAGIRKSDGTFHCLACGETHELYEVISHCFRHEEDILGKFGWDWLIKNFASVQVEERKDVYLDFARHNGISISRNISDSVDDICNQEPPELDNYRYYHPYWKKRGITDEYVVELFDLGYDSNTNCITFPVRDVNGNCLFVARRSVVGKFFNYPSGVEKPLYGLYELWRQAKDGTEYENGEVIKEHYNSEYFPKEVIICESMLDALSFWQIGKYAVALNGTGTKLQYQQLSNLPCRKFILATDSDDAGMNARQKLRLNVRTKIMTEYIFPTSVKDANECLCQLGEDTLKNLKEIF